MSKRPSDDTFGTFNDIINPPKKAKTDKFQQHRVTIEKTVGNPESEWKPIKFQRDTWSKDTCFGCEFGMCSPDETQPALKGLWKLFSDNYGKEMCNDELAGLMAVFFKGEIYDPMVKQGHSCPEWTKEQILTHIEVHMLEPTVNAATQIQNLKYIERLLFNQIRLGNDTGDTKLDLKVLKSLLDVQKQIQTLYNSKPTRQLFYSDYLKLDERRANQQ